MSQKRLSESTINLPVFGKRELATPFTAEPILDQQDRDELRRLEQQSYARTLQTLLDRHSNLDLTGKVHEIDAAHPIPGGYSDIMLGYCTHEDGTRYRVAVKRLRFHIVQDTGFQKKLAKELYIWSKLNNIRILPLEGFYLEDNGCPSLVSRWMENGTILKYLESNPGNDLLKLISGIAEGIMYLHLNDIVHSDIKPDNVMISDSGEPLLCDFGISRMLVESRSFNFSNSQTGGLRGTVRFMSKELLQATESAPVVCNKASDIWAFGMTILSILTRKPPYHDISNDVQVITAICSGVLPSTPSDLTLWPMKSQILWRMCELCWKPVALREPIQNFVMELQVMEHSSLSYLADASSYRFHHLPHIPATIHQSSTDKPLWTPYSSNNALIGDRSTALRSRWTTGQVIFFLLFLVVCAIVGAGVTVIVTKPVTSIAFCLSAISRGMLPACPIDIKPWLDPNIYLWNLCTDFWDLISSERPTKEQITVELEVIRKYHAILDTMRSDP
ncbi:hypothetical protein ACEPAI_8578 [Sanghuangporus weigelae]